MTRKDFKYIYGPVSSWRLGVSLGIDPISCKEKVCTFDCVYCQVGRTKALKDKREVFIPTEKITEEIKSLPALEIDYITFSGKGEPTLAKNLSEIIKGIRNLRREKIAIITNSSLIDRVDVQKDLKLADFVMLKLDACCEEIFKKVNRPIEGITFNGILRGIKDFRPKHKGKLALQIMFIDENKCCVERMAQIAKEIKPDEVQINTPLRPCKVRPLSKEEIYAIKSHFEGMEVLSVYDARKKRVKPISKTGTLKRRGRDC